MTQSPQCISHLAVQEWHSEFKMSYVFMVFLIFTITFLEKLNTEDYNFLKVLIIRVYQKDQRKKEREGTINLERDFRDEKGEEGKRRIK